MVVVLGWLCYLKPLQKAINAARKSQEDPAQVIYLTPQGKLLDQTLAAELMNNKRIILLAGRYEGIDERFDRARSR